MSPTINSHKAAKIHNPTSTSTNIEANTYTGPDTFAASAIIKQMKIIYEDGFSKEEKITYKNEIFQIILEAMRALIINSSMFEFSLSEDNKVMIIFF